VKPALREFIAAFRAELPADILAATDKVQRGKTRRRD